MLKENVGQLTKMESVGSVQIPTKTSYVHFHTNALGKVMNISSPTYPRLWVK